VAAARAVLSRAGILPRLVAGLFDAISDAEAANSEFTLTASAVEIYNEVIRDLLGGVDTSAVGGGAGTRASLSTASDGDEVALSASFASGRESDVSFSASASSGRLSIGPGLRSSSVQPAGPDKAGLQIREDPEKGVYVAGAVTVCVTSPYQVFQCLEMAMSNRAVAATGMNAQSSRSHSVFQLTMSRRNTDTYIATRSTLFIVDLAGSEKVSKTGARDERLKEAQSILYSLHALGNVINALTDRKSTHIPYRDSKCGVHAH
jgi:hypothetical protein